MWAQGEGCVARSRIKILFLDYCLSKFCPKELCRVRLKVMAVRCVIRGFKGRRKDLYSLPSFMKRLGKSMR